MVLTARRGFFLRLFTLMFAKETNYNPHFWREENQLSVPRVHTAALIES